MPEMHLKQPGFTYSSCGPFTKNKDRIKKIKETSDSRYVYQNELDKACFQLYMAYGDFKHLNRRTAVNKVLSYNAFTIARSPKYDGYQGGLASKVYNFFDKKASSGTIKKEIMQNEELAKELHKPIIRKFEKRKVHPSFIDNIWDVDLSVMQSTGKFNKGFRFLLCVIVIYGKYGWVIPLKNKKGTTTTNAVQKF